jgi:Family of unknown function (DUF6444)
VSHAGGIPVVHRGEDVKATATTSRQDDPGEQRELLARLRAVVEAKDAENAVLLAELAAERERRRRLELKVAELERRLGQDSTTSGTPPSKDPIAARERRKAEKKERQSSERERSKDRKRGGQPGHPGAGLSRDPDPERKELPPHALLSGSRPRLALTTPDAASSPRGLRAAGARGPGCPMSPRSA